jgi:transcriptional regulator with XRE-family HTH domain
MPNVTDSTESLLDRTKRLLRERGDLSLREIAEGAGVGHQWLRSIVYEAIEEPGVTKLEKVHNYLVEYQAAKRFQERETRVGP